MAGFSVVQAVTAAAAEPTASTTHRSGATEAAEGKGSTTSAMLPPSVVHYSAAVTQLLQAPDLVPVKTFVSTALAAKLRGNAVNYRHIVETIRCVSWALGYTGPRTIPFDRSTEKGFCPVHDFNTPQDQGRPRDAPARVSGAQQLHHHRHGQPRQGAWRLNL